MESSTELYEKFDRKIWRTVGARFNGSRRLSSKQSWSIFTISILSLYNLVMSFPQLFVGSLTASSDFTSALSALASVFVLILSLLEASKGYELKAERLHNSAMRLNSLYSEYRVDPENMVPHIKEYHKLLESCPENHQPSDDALFRAEHYKDFELNWWQAKGIIACYFLEQRIFYIALLTTPLAFLIIRLICK